MTCTGNVKLVQGEASMFSDELKAYLEAGRNRIHKAVVTGNVRIVNNDITATGDEGIFYNDEQKFELNNNAKVWQNNNTITGHQIVVFLQEKILEGYSNEQKTERAVMTVYSKGKKMFPFGQPSETENTDTPENTSEEEASPIVVVADTLKLDDMAGLATFTGNVVATQEVNEFRSDEMNVYILKSPEGGNDVEKIELNGNVQITSETTVVTGEKGVYTAKEQYAVIEGSSQKMAHIEDKTQNMDARSPIIELLLATKVINLKGRARIEFDEGENESPLNMLQPTPTPKPKDQSKVKKEDLPSVTLYPGKKK